MLFNVEGIIMTSTQEKARALLEAIKAKRLAKEAAEAAEKAALPIFSPEEKQEDKGLSLEDMKSFWESRQMKPVEPEQEKQEQEEKKEEQKEKQKPAFQWNEAQKQFISLGISQQQEHQRIILTGPAGTGKTTAIKGLVQTLQQIAQLGGFPKLQSNTKYLQAGKLGVAFVSFTNKAVANIKRIMDEELKPHCLTIHKLLEYEPEFFEVWDAEKKELKTTRRFVPRRNSFNKLPHSLKLVVIDEASMVATAERNGEGKAVALFELLEDALHKDTKIIFSGDIQQLPPVFGDSILGHSLLKIPTVELTEVYRQALESPIILNAHRILKGQYGYFNSRTEKDPENTKRIIVPSFKKIEAESKGLITITPWQKKLLPEHALKATYGFFENLVSQGKYIPDEDIILCPFNVNYGTIEINKGIAQFLGSKREAEVHEVIAGFNKHYYAIGDKVMWQKEEYKIVNITRNAQYLGEHPNPPSKCLDRWGTYQKAGLTPEEMVALEHHQVFGSFDQEDAEKNFDFMLEQMAKKGDGDAERFNQASHLLELQNIADPDVETTLSTAGEINTLEFGYCITVHKSQGSEWRRVFILFHHTHAVMLFRELLYTAITRAREEVHIICEPNSLEKCIKNPRIKGDTIEAKAAFFTNRKEMKKQMAAAQAKLAGMSVDDSSEDEEE